MQEAVESRQLQSHQTPKKTYSFFPFSTATTAPTKVLASPTDIYRAAQVATDTAVPESGIVLPTILTAVGGIILVVMAGILLF